MMRHFLFLFAVLATASMVQAGLEFDKPEQSKVVQVQDTEIATKFSFKITGDKPVKILDIQTTCSCVRAQTEDGRMLFQPGETGVIDTAFEVGAFEGELTKEVKVTTDDSKHPGTNLLLRLSIPGLFQITPAQVIWQLGEAPTPKLVTIKVLGKDPVALTGAISSRETMTTSIRSILPGKEYEVSLTPAATDSKMLGLVRLETDSKYPRYQKRLVFFNITDKKPLTAGPRPGAPGALPVPPPALGK